MTQFLDGKPVSTVALGQVTPNGDLLQVAELQTTSRSHRRPRLPSDNGSCTDRVAANAKAAPLVSVIMPVRNEEAFIAESLNAVLAQDFPADCIEVIVVDGQSTDSTRDIVRSLQSQHCKLRLINNPGRIAPSGLNIATAVATGEIVIRVDGHCIIAKDYVRRCVDRLLDHKADGVGGAIETIGLTPMSRIIARATSSRFGVGGSSFRTTRDQTLEADTIPFPAYRRGIIEQAGPYDEELARNQDDEYNYRLRKMGARLILAADIRSRYYCRSTLRSLADQYFQYGYWKVRVLQKHPWQMRPRQFVPGLFVGSLLCSLLLTPFSSLGVWMLAGLGGAYVVANLCASIRVVGERDWRLLTRLPAVFTTIHISYGLGFVVGLLKFWNRWGSRADKPNETWQSLGSTVSARVSPSA